MSIKFNCADGLQTDHPFGNTKIRGKRFFVLAHVVLSLLAYMLPCAATYAETYRYTITQNTDDGTEVDGQVWYENGISESVDYLGCNAAIKYEIGLRFITPDLVKREHIEYARLRFPSFGSDIHSGAKFVIEGVLQENPSTFSQGERPSQKLPKTKAKLISGNNLNSLIKKT